MCTPYVTYTPHASVNTCQCHGLTHIYCFYRSRQGGGWDSDSAPAVGASTGSIALYSNLCCSRARPHAPHAAAPRPPPAHLSRRLRIHYEYTIGAESLKASHWAQTLPAAPHADSCLLYVCSCRVGPLTPARRQCCYAQVYGGGEVGHWSSSQWSPKLIRAKFFPRIR